MFKKRKEKIISDQSTVEYWQNRIKPGMKLNNTKVHNPHLKYKNFIVPAKYDIIVRVYREQTSISLRHLDIAGETNWYDVYKDGISAEIIQEDIMSPTNPCAEINLPF